MWCPVCKNEYVEGVTHCPDCDVDLVEELAEEDAEKIKVPEDYEFPEDFDPREVLAAAAALSQQEPKEKPELVRTYKSPEERYSDMYSSAWTFLILGMAGTAFSILCLLGLIKLPVHEFVLFVMTFLFVIFILVGIISFQSAKKLKGSIASENDFVDEVISWYRSTGAKSAAFETLDLTQPEELLYFQRSELIRTLLKEQFPQIDQALLEKLTDDFCEENYSE